MDVKPIRDNLLFWHQRFLDNNTGLTIDRSKQHFVFNPDGVLSNNRHTVGYTRLESQPNGDATTEGQSVILKENSIRTIKDNIFLLVFNLLVSGKDGN